jgi:hypothetical protein
MSGIRETFRAAGIWLMADDEWPAVSAGCAGLARRLRERRARTIGLEPADDDVAVPAVALHLGSALAGGTAGVVAIVDTFGSWTAPTGAGAVAAEDPSGLVTAWLREDLAVLTPRAVGPGAALQGLRSVIEGESAEYDHLIFDLTGFDHVGEQLAAYDLLEAVVLVARSGRTTVRGIQRRLREVPGARFLGVLLTGT